MAPPAVMMTTVATVTTSMLCSATTGATETRYVLELGVHNLRISGLYTAQAEKKQSKAALGEEPRV